MAESLSVIAYLDILGFKELWKNDQATALEVLYDIKKENLENTEFPEIQISSYSDNILAWFLLPEDSNDKFVYLLTKLFARISSLSLYHLQRGVNTYNGSS